MESVESQSACLIEKPQVLHYDSLLSTRRRRREIRLLKKLSCTPPPSKGLNVIQQGVPTKRAGSRPVHGCNPLYLLDDGEPAEDATSAGKNISRIVEDGLIRSRSFPPEGWQSSKYILQISRVGRSLDKGEMSPAVTSRDGHRQILSAISMGSTDGCANFLHQSKMTVDRSSQPGDMDTQNGGTSPLCGGLESCSAGNLSHEALDMDVDVKQPDATHSMAPDAVVDGLYMAGKSALLQNVEGNLLNSCQSGPLEVKEARESTNCPPSGKVLICGRRREMEDTAVIIPSFAQLKKSDFSAMTPSGSLCDLHFYGVYDGHGGSQASSYCAERLHHALAEEIAHCSMTEETSGIIKWQSAMVSCFAKVDKEVGGVCPYGACDDVDSTAVCCKGSIAPENVGTTAVVAVVSSSQIVLANCGDSRAVLSRGGIAIPLSMDHKPERVDETNRIEAAGGRVIAWKGYRVGALLAVSRAIGDRYLKRYVISEPDVVCFERTDEDECLILASDGLWDVIDNDTACDVARRCLASARGRERRRTSRGEDFASATAAATLVKLACGKGSQDNITVVVVDLSRRQQ
ncbi:hypothetical protein GOP47_0021645 [Adiantum capillus-veneris]|uniref:protein-serine/threonine phosphatase n=1 Tax=Adiantum capillus-veneris TaxID=13818 RepID=A0A9D4Z5F6_ADICA|nr:hypothetical protein GOP47_0021645 [Adiantum capillus-veneris]